MRGKGHFDPGDLLGRTQSAVGDGTAYDETLGRELGT